MTIERIKRAVQFITRFVAALALICYLGLAMMSNAADSPEGYGFHANFGNLTQEK